MDKPYPIPVLGFAAWSGSGKTTLIEGVIPLLIEQGVRVAYIKHAHHRVDLDQPGKDSHRMRTAGAIPVILATSERWALLTETPQQQEPQLDQLLWALPTQQLDLVFVEGFKHASIPKIEVIRHKSDRAPLHLDDMSFIAVATNLKHYSPMRNIEQLNLDDPITVSHFIQAWIGRSPMNNSPIVSSQSQPSTHLPLLDVDEARARIYAAISPIRGTIRCHLKEGLGGIVATPICSPLAVPGYDNSAMDGYALNSADLPSVGQVTLKVVGHALAGAPYTPSLHAGEVVRIMTGAMIPNGADTVIMQEQVTVTDDQHITINSGHHASENVRKIGEDIEYGATVLPPGRQIGAAELGLLASLGIAEFDIIRPLRVVTFSTGDELCSVGQPLAAGQIYDSNRYTLFGLLHELGVNHIDMGVIPDQRDAVVAAFTEAAHIADVVITSGGVSVGDADYVKETIERLGKVNLWKIAMKPGKPLAFGTIENAWFFGLPGNPVSSMVTFMQIVRPTLQALQGRRVTPPLRLQAATTSPLKKRPGRADYQRGILSQDGTGALTVRTTGPQGSHILSSMSQANCLIILPAATGDIEAGDMVTVEPFSTTL